MMKGTAMSATMTPEKPSERTEVLERLDRLISENMANVVEKTELYRLVSDPGTDAALVTAVVRHTMLDSFSFTPYLAPQRCGRSAKCRTNCRTR